MAPDRLLSARMIKQLGSYVRVLKVFSGRAVAGLTIRQIAQLTGGSYGWAHAACTSMISNGILLAHRVGHAVLCSVNTHSKTAALLLELGHALDRGAANKPRSPKQTSATTRPRANRRP